MAEPDVKIELAADLDRARLRLARNFDALRHDLDVGAHIKESFRHNKAAFIGGASFLGLVLSRLPVRRKKIEIEGKGKDGVKQAEKAGIWLLVLDFAFKTLRPLLTSFVTKQVADYMRSRARPGGDA
jgi:hypothetical protein